MLALTMPSCEVSISSRLMQLDSFRKYWWLMNPASKVST